jgi:hypothetical protein
MESRKKNLSRRNFFGTSGIAGLSLGTASRDSQAAQRTGKRVATGADPEQLSDNLYRLEDTCNVYLIRNGNLGTLIDFGAGRILDFLPQLGVTHVDGILHTHHHLDQCQGDHLAAGRGIPIAVPTYEHHLFTDVENFWRNRVSFTRVTKPVTITSLSPRAFPSPRGFPTMKLSAGAAGHFLFCRPRGTRWAQSHS